MQPSRITSLDFKLRFGLRTQKENAVSHDSQGEVEVRVREIVLTHWQGPMPHSEEIDINTPILGKGLGLDSLEALVLVTKIEAEFGIQIDDEELTVKLFDNIGTLAEHVKKKLAANNDRRGENGD